MHERWLARWTLHVAEGSASALREGLTAAGQGVLGPRSEVYCFWMTRVAPVFASAGRMEIEVEDLAGEGGSDGL